MARPLRMSSDTMFWCKNLELCGNHISCWLAEYRTSWGMKQTSSHLKTTAQRVCSYEQGPLICTFSIVPFLHREVLIVSLSSTSGGFTAQYPLPLIGSIQACHISEHECNSPLASIPCRNLFSLQDCVDGLQHYIGWGPLCRIYSSLKTGAGSIILKQRLWPLLLFFCLTSSKGFFLLICMAEWLSDAK